ncbi:MAG: hypothetical protein RLZZ28_922 [Bacteroidota bacterium]|jgi:ubiquinone/menaquinone biosynthesis C-methylase UbiE
MRSISTLFKTISSFFTKNAKTTEAETAYDIWASQYDAQPNNLMLFLDEKLVASLMAETTFTNKSVIDIGCGTGRHWPKILSEKPLTIKGYDVSREMLSMAIKKFPDYFFYQLQNNLLPELDGSVDLIISTLTIAHIEDITAALKEWTRVLKPGGEILLTDYHPEALAKGAKRTFQSGNKLITIKNYVHSIEKIEHIAGQLGLSFTRIVESKIDESVISFYENQNALSVYEKFKGMKIIYGVRLKKRYAHS